MYYWYVFGVICVQIELGNGWRFSPIQLKEWVTSTIRKLYYEIFSSFYFHLVFFRSEFNIVAFCILAYLTVRFVNYLLCRYDTKLENAA